MMAEAFEQVFEGRPSPVEGIAQSRVNLLVFGDIDVGFGSDLERKGPQ